MIDFIMEILDGPKPQKGKNVEPEDAGEEDTGGVGEPPGHDIESCSPIEACYKAMLEVANACPSKEDVLVVNKRIKDTGLIIVRIPKQK